jgi:TRAP transporter TAXI family solute receptor
MSGLLRARSTLILLGLGALVAWLIAAKLMTPTSLTILTGPEGSGTHADALRYQALLERRGVRTTVEATDGSVENLRRLVREGGNQIAFAEVGLEKAVDEPELEEKLVSLGSVSVQPLWLFVRRGLEVDEEADLEGRRVVLGAAGSGTRVFAGAILAANGVADRVDTVTVEKDEPEQSVQALKAGTLDGLFALGEPDAPSIREALSDDGIKALPFRRAAAYERRYPGLIAVTVPEGALDLARNVPEQDLALIALATNLVAPEDLHPSLVDVILAVATRVHLGPNVLTAAYTFPSSAEISLPLDRRAEHFYQEGPPPFVRYLPFWLAGLLNRTLLLISALAGLIVVLLQTVPPLLSAHFNRNLGAIYKRLETVERSFGTRDFDRKAALETLDELVQKTAQLKIPFATLRAPYFEMRQNLHDVRDRVEGATQSQ